MLSLVRSQPRRASSVRRAGHAGGKKNARVCAQNYSGVKFIAPTQGPIPNPSLDPVPAGD